MRLVRLCDRLLGGAGRRDIADETEAADLLGHLVHGLLLHVQYRHLGAGRGQLAGRLGAKAGTTAGHDRCKSFNVHVFESPRCGGVVRSQRYLSEQRGFVRPLGARYCPALRRTKPLPI